MKKTLCALLFASAIAAPALADQPVTINFAGEIGGKPFACGETYSGLGATGASVATPCACAAAPVCTSAPCSPAVARIFRFAMVVSSIRCL